MLGMHTWWTRRSVDITIVGKGRVRAVQFTIWFCSYRIGNFCTCCAHWRTDGFCLSVTRPYKIAWMFPWSSLHTVQLLCVHTSKVSELFAEINRILWWLSFYGMWFWIFTSSKKKNMKHSLQLWQRIRGLIKDHYRVAFCQLLFENRVSQIFYYL